MRENAKNSMQKVKVSVKLKPNEAFIKRPFSSLNFSIPPIIATPDGSFVQSAPIIPSQLIKSGNIAYSSGDKSRVKIGVASIPIPFVKAADAVYHKDARAGTFIAARALFSPSIYTVFSFLSYYIYGHSSFLYIRLLILPKVQGNYSPDAKNSAKMNDDALKTAIIAVFLPKNAINEGILRKYCKYRKNI
jgi:hypothetical protein